jgi:chemotaxis response regulator CheB
MKAGVTRSILLVGRNELLREGMRIFFARSRSIQIVGTIARPEKAKSAVRALHPDVVLLEVTRESAATIPGQLLRELAPSGRVITVSVGDDTTTIFAGSRMPVTVPGVSLATLARLITQGTPAGPVRSGAAKPGSVTPSRQREKGRPPRKAVVRRRSREGE